MKVAIFGSGWLGLQVGNSFKMKGAEVYASYRSDETKINILKNEFEPFYFEWNDAKSVKVIPNIDVVFISIPPYRENVSIYVEGLSWISNAYSDAHLIFVSSTGVYPQKDGTYTEDYGITHESNILYQAEQAIANHPQNTILRCAGLIGQNRHPSFSLSGRTLSHAGNGVINLIHGKDILNAVNIVIEENLLGIYNLTYPSHPVKKDYYNSIATELDLSPIAFGDRIEPNRIIDGSKISDCSTFEYIYSPDQYIEIENIDVEN